MDEITHRTIPFTYTEGRLLSSCSDEELKAEMERRRLAKFNKEEINNFFRTKIRPDNYDKALCDVIEDLALRGLEQVKKGY